MPSFKYVSFVAAFACSTISPLMANVEFNGYVSNTDPSTWPTTTGSAIKALQVGASLVATNGSIMMAGSDTSATAKYVTVGGVGVGQFTVADHATMTSNYLNVKKGEVLISGGTWNSLGAVKVGAGGGSVSAKLIVENGGTFLVNGSISGILTIGNSTDGSVKITGSGSSITIKGHVTQGGIVTLGGLSGASEWVNGNLTVTNHAKFTGDGTMTINSGSKVIVDAGAGSQLTMRDYSSEYISQSGAITNDGTVRLFASTLSAASTYTPLSATVYAGTTGTYEGVGGVWNSTNHTFTVNAALTASAGQTLTGMNLSVAQRAIFTGSGGKTAGISLLAGDTVIDLTANEVTGNSLSALAALAVADNSEASVLSAWTFTPTGLASDSPAVLTLQIGNVDINSLLVWQLNGDSWTAYSSDDFVYTNGYAYFGISNFNSYAITGVAVPEPCTIGLIGLAGFGLLIRKHRAS